MLIGQFFLNENLRQTVQSSSYIGLNVFIYVEDLKIYLIEGYQDLFLLP